MKNCGIFIVFLLCSALYSANIPATERTLVVTNSATWPPFSFINEEGEPDGILIDLWSQFGIENDVTIEFKLTRWQTSLDLIREGKADVHAGLFESEQRREYMDFSSTINVPLATRLFVSHKLKVSSVAELAGVPVAITDGGFEQNHMAKHYPSIELVPYSNSTDAIQAAVDGEVLAFISDYPAAMYYLHQWSTPEDFYVVETLYRENLKAAVPLGNKATLEFVNQGLDSMPTGDFNRIVNKWMLPESRIPTWLMPSLILGMTAFILVSSLVYIAVLKRQVKSRTEALELISITDSLTGLFNRKKIEDQVEHAKLETLSSGVPFALILIDIDHFKLVNDSLGHLMGDKVLKLLADLFKDNLAVNDSIGRWGGEEFLFVCSDCTLEAALLKAESLRKAIEQYDFGIGPNGCTASFGVTEISKQEAVDDAFRRADEALYQAKRNGRNRVESVF
ncbi:sensor domain-containing diguanylate cyclase [Vibrio tapetis subsp. quintayensis]|uniref:sensor domain-containing diguanylate cyclase n=1 Tax=Vibrio tapetis TaxID=52443 RepID=UPI0025B2B58B|nr:sensor domain-containing diguanylate cyclase [Vibrio tapetis]MDN3679699.1 sensor domain-containing diguanylate cyclase [Vibrio tapetis subsp. quintayensis]